MESLAVRANMTSYKGSFQVKKYYLIYFTLFIGLSHSFKICTFILNIKQVCSSSLSIQEINTENTNYSFVNKDTALL